jgi:hypothetical protein
MGAIGWIWAWLMLLGGLRAWHSASLPSDLICAMLLSGLVALPLLWSRKDGILATVAPSPVVRAGLAIMLLVSAGVSHPEMLMSLRVA